MSPPSSTAEAPFPFPSTREPVRIDGLAFVALAVADPGAAARFYTEVLDCAADTGRALPRSGEHAVLRTGSGQRVILSRSDGTPQAPDLGRHLAFGVSEVQRDGILQRVRERSITVEDYEEDRSAERFDNVYFRDPDGNRIQLVVATPAGTLDHVAIQAVDIEWAEDLYVGLLGGTVDEVVGWRTEDYRRAKRWGEGLESMAPGTRRWDKRFALRPGQGPMVARPNMQLFVRTGAATLGVFLAYERYQLPPEAQVSGTPRLGFAVSANEFATIAARFAEAKLPVDGPHRHPEASPYRESLYTRDRDGNFLEFCVAR
jgi:catechol 2,3-dioxygenase-like lactoylglutathione lyase family enzyme